MLSYWSKNGVDENSSPFNKRLYWPIPKIYSIFSPLVRSHLAGWYTVINWLTKTIKNRPHCIWKIHRMMEEGFMVWTKIRPVFHFPCLSHRSVITCALFHGRKYHSKRAKNYFEQDLWVLSIKNLAKNSIAFPSTMWTGTHSEWNADVQSTKLNCSETFKKTFDDTVKQKIFCLYFVG